MDTLESRVAALEQSLVGPSRRARLWKVTAIACMIALFAQIAVSGEEKAEQAPRTITAGMIRLVNVDGSNSVALSGAGLFFFGKNGPTLTLDSTGLSFCDKAGTDRLVLRIREDGSPRLDLHDKRGRSRATLGVSHLPGASMKTAESSLVLRDKEGRVIFQAPRE